MMVDSDTFRTVLGQFPTGVTVVTFSSDPPHGITVNAFSSVSLDPPLILICLEHDTKSHQLLQNTELNQFCINILSADQVDLGKHFASIEEADEDPLAPEITTTAVTGAPILDGVVAYLDCEVEQAIPAGDHTIYIGEVVDLDVLDPTADAVTFFRGEWGSTS